MKISLVYPIKNAEKELAESLNHIEIFFKKFPLQTEVILVNDPSQDQTHMVAQDLQRKLKSDRFDIQFITNSIPLGRAKSLTKGLRHATGDLIFCGSIDLNIPLAEYFNFIQEFIQNPQYDLIIGNRKDLKKPRHGKKPRITQIFENIEEEKLIKSGSPLTDPTCQFLALRNHALQGIQDEIFQTRDWFYSPAITHAAYQKKFSIAEKSIICHDRNESQFRWWKSLF